MKIMVFCSLLSTQSSLVTKILKKEKVVVVVFCSCKILVAKTAENIQIFTNSSLSDPTQACMTKANAHSTALGAILSREISGLAVSVLLLLFLGAGPSRGQPSGVGLRVAHYPACFHLPKSLP